MDTLSLVKEIAFILTISLGIILSFWVLLSNKKETTNRTFFLAIIFSLLWITFSFLGSETKDIGLALLFKRINFAMLMPFFVSAYFFSKSFPKKFEKNIVLLDCTLVAIGVLGFIISTFTQFVVAQVQLESWGNNITGGKGFTVFNVIIFAVTCLFFANLIRQFIKSSKEDKSRVYLLIIGAFLYAIFNIIFNVLIPIINKSYKFDFIGDYSIIFFIVFTSYAIIKRGLFNIKVIATETTVVALSLGLLIEVFLSNSVIEGLLKGLVWVLATYGGYVLIKSVKVEIKQREELQVLATKLDEANKHLEELDEAKDNFLSMASHELNTPIAAIEGYLSMIIDEKMCGPVEGKIKEYLTTVYGSSKRLAALVRDLLNVSRIESNRIHIIYEQAQIEDVINQAVAEVAIKAKEVGHTLIFEKPAAPLPKTYLDVSRIVEVIINLIGNAIKYTDPGGKITVRAQADDQKIVVSVEDNGRGIPKDKEEHIFEKFSQVDVLKDQVKGTGLGMFISKNLVELHKGQLWFKSHIGETDHGTTFYFSLPILKEKPADPHEGEGALFQTGQPKKQPAINVPPQTPNPVVNKTASPVSDNQAQVTEDGNTKKEKE